MGKLRCFNNNYNYTRKSYKIAAETLDCVKTTRHTRGMKIVSMSFNLVVKLEDCTNFFYENLKISLVLKLYFRFYYVL